MASKTHTGAQLTSTSCSVKKLLVIDETGMGQEGNRAGGNHRVAEGSIRNLKASGNVALIILSRLPFLSIMPSYSFLLILSVQDFHV